MDWPTSGNRAFGAARATHTHAGVDLQAIEGAPIYAAVPGRLAWATRSATPGFTGYGRVVVVDSDDGASQLYGHLLEPRRQVGELVDAGDVIGLAGRSQFLEDDPRDERSTMGAHLHFEVAPASYPMRSDAPRLEPLAYLLSRPGSYHPTEGRLMTAPVTMPPAALLEPALEVSTRSPAPASRARGSGLAPFVALLAGAALLWSVRR
jgi:murein DD-endopeptidase MepM/ murein hydrolase activator NlpD